MFKRIFKEWTNTIFLMKLATRNEEREAYYAQKNDIFEASFIENEKIDSYYLDQGIQSLVKDIKKINKKKKRQLFTFIVTLLLSVYMIFSYNANINVLINDAKNDNTILIFLIVLSTMLIYSLIVWLFLIFAESQFSETHKLLYYEKIKNSNKTIEEDRFLKLRQYFFGEHIDSGSNLLVSVIFKDLLFGKTSHKLKEFFFNSVKNKNRLISLKSYQEDGEFYFEELIRKDIMNDEMKAYITTFILNNKYLEKYNSNNMNDLVDLFQIPKSKKGKISKKDKKVLKHTFARYKKYKRYYQNSIIHKNEDYFL